MGVIRGSRRPKELMRLRILPPGLRIREPVGIRYLRTTQAATTPALVLQLLYSTTENKTPPPVWQRSRATRSAFSTQRLVFSLSRLMTQARTTRRPVPAHSPATPLAPSTQPMVLMLSPAILPATEILQSAVKRFLTTTPVRTTWQWVLIPSLATPAAIATQRTALFRSTTTI